MVVFLCILTFFISITCFHQAKARTVEFSGYRWRVKDIRNYKKGPGPNFWSDSTENVRVDSDGGLHLKVTERNGNWYCAEIYLDRFLGYGEYVFYLSPQKEELPDEVVLGLFLYGGPGEELDIEISGWDKDEDPNVQFVVQPAYIAGHLDKLKTNPLHQKRTFKITLEEKVVTFSLLKGHNPDPNDQASLIERWTFTRGEVPKGKLYPRMNLWIFEGDPPEKRGSAEIVIDKFEFIK